MMANFDYVKNHVFENDLILKSCLIRLCHFTIICIYMIMQYMINYMIFVIQNTLLCPHVFAFKPCCSVDSLKIDLKINHATFG